MLPNSPFVDASKLDQETLDFYRRAEFPPPGVPLVYSKAGGRYADDSGTWVCRDVAYEYTMWLHPKLRNTFRRLMSSSDRGELTVNHKAAKVLPNGVVKDEHWVYRRQVSKEIFSHFCGRLRYHKLSVPMMTNRIYQGAYDTDAEGVAVLFGVDQKANLRDGLPQLEIEKHTAAMELVRASLPEDGHLDSTQRTQAYRQGEAAGRIVSFFAANQGEMLLKFYEAMKDSSVKVMEIPTVRS